MEAWQQPEGLELVTNSEKLGDRGRKQTSLHEDYPMVLCPYRFCVHVTIAPHLCEPTEQALGCWEGDWPVTKVGKRMHQIINGLPHCRRVLLSISSLMFLVTSLKSCFLQSLIITQVFISHSPIIGTVPYLRLFIFVGKVDNEING